jgi:hypothetical protein
MVIPSSAALPSRPPLTGSTRPPLVTSRALRAHGTAPARRRQPDATVTPTRPLRRSQPDATVTPTRPLRRLQPDATVTRLLALDGDETEQGAETRGLRSGIRRP